MKKKWIKIIAMCLAAAVVVLVGINIFAWYNKKSSAKTPDFVLLYAENQMENYPTTMGAQKFADLVYERTEGRIQILIKPAAELGSESQVIEQMQYGGIAFARVSLSQIAEFIPDLNILQLPYLYRNSDHMWKVLDGEIGDYYLSKTNDVNLVGLSWYDAGARNFYSTKPIETLDDLKGMNIRVQESDMMADMASALGGNPVKIVYSEVYSAIEQGIVDCAENNWPSYEAMNHYDVAKYYTIDEHTRVPELQICSKIVWSQIDEKDRQTILKCAKESALYERELWQEREKISRQIAEKSGITVITLSESEKKRFRDAMAPVYQKYCGNQMDMIEKIMNY